MNSAADRRVRIQVFGIRHHGPGCARSLLTALDEYQPDVVLVEGPADADQSIALAAREELVPPVALLLYPSDEPKRGVYYPFVVFSPEWQALRWALKRQTPVHFMDLPQAHHFALQSQEGKTESEAEKLDDNPTWRVDPLALLAEAAGYKDHELWWEQQIERRANATGLFEAILEAMRTVRSAVPETTDRDLLREAHMRKTIRELAKGMHERIAVDGLGSTTAVTDSAGVIVQRFTYDSFGRLQTDSSVTGPTYGFAGEERDSVSEWSYHRARYYDPELGRFISRDPFAGYVDEPLTRQKYMYAGDDPVNKVDPTGRNYVGGIVGVSFVAGLAGWLGNKVRNSFVVPSNIRSAKYDIGKLPSELVKAWALKMQGVTPDIHEYFFGRHDQVIDDSWEAFRSSVTTDVHLDTQVVTFMKTSWQLKRDVPADATHVGSGLWRIRFFPLFFQRYTNGDMIGYVLVHELMHALAGRNLKPETYGWRDANKLARTSPESAWENADTYALEAQFINAPEMFEAMHRDSGPRG